MTMFILSARVGAPPYCTMDRRQSRGLLALRGLSLVLGLLAFAACDAGQNSSLNIVAEDAGAASVTPEESRMWMTVGEHRFAIALIDNAAARAFAAHMPLTLDMSELNGNEKHAELPASLPTNASRPGTIRNGDLMLYGKNTLVVFYSTFSSSYSYTRLGRVEDPTGLAKALGRSSARVEFAED